MKRDDTGSRETCFDRTFAYARVRWERDGYVPLERICREEATIAADCAGTLQVKTQDVGLKGGWKTDVLRVNCV
jgi:hypothetical protein